MADQQRDVVQNQNMSLNTQQAVSISQNQFHYPHHLHVDPVASFYQRTLSQPQLPRSQSAHQQPYYIPDMATVALQQMQLHTMLQLHANQQQNRDASTATTTITTTPQTSQQLHQIQPFPVPHNSRMLNPQSLMPTIQPHHSSHIPVVPDSQMASAYRIGRYTPAERKIRLERYREKRAQRNYNRRVKYDCRKQIADKRRRVQGRFVKREQEIALAASEIVLQQRNSEATDATEEDDTKLQPPESSASASSVRQLEHVDGEQESFCEQSEQILQTFR